ncbi:hypothetical protein DFH08DRAFT_816538 [Mycena albidolilacea]|uniref:Uncharacterized protein n=1 Tax=Mycena albidolilacea TaxID=1033008 RepID=A0AAD6ZJT1_9AGAR|nr:hypothetical protein DFH08DRAFT_816538 [Mycena albidolilacea]
MGRSILEDVLRGNSQVVYKDICLTRVTDTNTKCPRATIQLLLAACPRLALLVVLWSSKTFDWDGQLWVRDEYTPVIRDVRLVGGIYTHYWADWEAGARDLPNFWTVAEDFVAPEKRSSAIARTVQYSNEYELQENGTIWSGRRRVN